MLLKDVKNLDAKCIFGINVKPGDIELIDNFHSLREVSVLFEQCNDGVLLEEILDFLISVKLKNIKAILEIDTQKIPINNIDIKYIFQLANNINVDISLLPDPNNINKYKEHLVLVTKELLSRPNFGQKIHPISGAIEFYVLKSIIKEKISLYKPKDEYMIDSFMKRVPIEYADECKVEIYKMLVDHFGGEDKLTIAFATLTKKVLEKTRSAFVDHVKTASSPNNLGASI